MATFLEQSKIIISTDFAGDTVEDIMDTDAEAEVRHVAFGRPQHGSRLDRALAELVPEFSRSYLQQLVEGGAVQLNGCACTRPSTKVRVGDAGQVLLRPTPQSQAFKPELLPLDVVYEDEHLRVICKPAGLVVHPAPGNWTGTLLNGLLALDERAAALPRAGIVHRLDKDTSGLMVVARSRRAMDALVQSIGARQVHRQYLALAHREWTGPERRLVDAAIGRDPRNRLRMAVVDLTRQSGKTAVTELAVLQSANGFCWVQCTLQTGRTHQIRVHMASIGHPLVGDTLYGGAAGAGLARQALHACRLAFSHPVSGQSLEFRAQPPADMLAALQSAGLRYNEVHA